MYRHIHSFKENPVFGVAAVRHSFEAACLEEGETLQGFYVVYISMCVCVFARVLACAYLSLPFSSMQDEPAMLLQAP